MPPPNLPGPCFEPAEREAWGRDLPEAIRQACLALVAARWPNWKAVRRSRNAGQVLGECRRFWHWQMERRPIEQVCQLSRRDLEAYQQQHLELGRAPGTINATLDEIMALLKTAAEHGQPVEAAVFRLRPLPRAESLPRHLGLAECQHLEHALRAGLSTAAPQRRLELACWFVLAHTGLRAGECLDLLGRDLELGAGRLMVRGGKGQKDRVVYLSPTARRAVSDYLAGQPVAADGPLLHRGDGRRLTYAWLYAHIRQLAAQAGVAEVSPHRLRHSLATQLLNVGMDITRIQKLLGHKFLNTTQLYARVQDTTLERDYQQAMQHLERQAMPLSSQPEPVADWPAQREVPVDNSL